MNGIKNFIIVGIKVSRFLKNFLNIYLKQKISTQAEVYFDKNEEFLQTGLLLFFHLLDKKKIKEITNKILNDLLTQQT